MTARKRVGRPRLSANTLVRRGTARPDRARRTTKKKRSSPPEPRFTPRDFVAVATGYVDDVLSGSIIACRWTSWRVNDFDGCEMSYRVIRHSPGHRRTCRTSARSSSGCRTSKAAGPRRRLTSSPGRCSSWRPSTASGGRTAARLVTTVFFEVGRKSAKSTLVAACGALSPGASRSEPGAQVVCGASTGNQARIVFSIMQRMVRRAPWLREAGFVAYANAITFDATGGYAKPINAKSSTQDGLNPVVHQPR